ncbi:hypothetical protein TA3x_002283 [Tundrisphaera sp. TA3]|uniref:hypothetical protein n=1 Tax=Tundrisphaera sp. TA3 TaxID=3435775 RepID=UPI003EBE9C92
MSKTYFSPTYFSPAYFSNLAIAPSPVPVTVPARTRDRQSYRAILDALSEGGEFDQILFGQAGPRARAGADSYPVLMVIPKGWEEIDDADPTSLVRRAKFALTIVIRDEDPERGFDELDRLACLVVDALDGSDLGGTALPALTKVRSARYPRAANPEQIVELEGEFTSLYQVPQS